MSQRGLLITIEGVEGAGKSTALSILEAVIRDAGIDLLCTREPGGTRLGESLRALLLDPEAAITPIAELLLIFAARAQHLEQVIRPAMQAGRWVLCDRFTDASYAYQGGGRLLGTEPVQVLEDLAQGSLRPDITLLLDVPVEVGLERARGRGALDRFEREDIDFFHRVRAAYRERAAQGGGRYRVIDASEPLPLVEEKLRAFAMELSACPPQLEDGR